MLPSCLPERFQGRLLPFGWLIPEAKSRKETRKFLYYLRLIICVVRLKYSVKHFCLFISPSAAAAAAAKSLQSGPTLCDPIDGSPPGSPVPGILQARTLKWVAISFSNV